MGSVDIGGSRASMAMITAEVLGLDIDEVRPVVADTDSIGHTDVTGGSRTTLATGQAVYEAAHDALLQLKQRAARLWEKKPEEVTFDGRVFSAKGEGISPITVKQLAPRLARTGGPVVGRATVNARGVGPAFAVTLVDLEVDPDTGKTQVLRCTVAQDAGRARGWRPPNGLPAAGTRRVPGARGTGSRRRPSPAQPVSHKPHPTATSTLRRTPTRPAPGNASAPHTGVAFRRRP